MLQLILLYGGTVIGIISKIEKNIPEIKNRIRNIIEMDYEKKRYELEKENNKEQDIIFNELEINDKRIALLEELKKELEDYRINYLDNKLDKEMYSLEHTNKLLNKMHNE